jgi:hypothetical protein|tara:strand:- start:760 stop:1119 length:360 start_codon:yes stop_codon:yes gene_type:complete
MMFRFDELNWHDSELLSLSWSCSDSGEDSIDIELDYIVDYEPEISTERKRIRFHDCRKLHLSCDLGITSPESIRDGKQDKGKAFEEFRKVAVRCGISTDDYESFSLILNTSGGRIEVFA